MSNAEFTSAFEAFLAAVGKYNAAQRNTLLNGFKADLQEALSAIGQPQPEPAAAAPAAAAPAPAAAAPAPVAAAGASASANKADGTSVTGAKPSSRVLQGPGGNSSFSLSGGDDRPASHSGRKQYGGNSSNNSSIQFGASDGDAKTSVKVHAAPGGKSSIQFGDDSAPGAQAKPQQRVDRLDDSAAHPKKPHGGRKLIHAAGGETHDVFNQKPDAAAAGGAVHTSVKTHAAPGGNSQISLGGGDAKAAAAAPAEAAPAAAEAGASSSAGGSEVSPVLLKAIIDAVYRKGKVKDTFTKFTGNKGKVLTAPELKDGVLSIGINGFTDAQAETLLARFAADKKNMSYPEFMKMMSAN